MREAFAMQKLLKFQKKYWHISNINIGNFNKTLTNNVSFGTNGPRPPNKKG